MLPPTFWVFLVSFRLASSGVSMPMKTQEKFASRNSRSSSSSVARFSDASVPKPNW